MTNRIGSISQNKVIIFYLEKEINDIFNVLVKNLNIVDSESLFRQEIDFNLKI